MLEMPQATIMGDGPREAMWAATNKATEVGMFKPVEAHIMPPHAWVLDMELQDLMAALLCFDFVLVQFFLVIHLYFLLEFKYLLCAFVSWKHVNFLLILQKLIAIRIF
jgi:hypothetical protein